MKRWLACIFLASFFGACGGGSGTGDGDGDGDGDLGTSTGGSSTGECTACSNGCCDGDTCVPYSSQTTSRCGADSNACIACEFGEACEDGECVIDESVCSPLSCDGCCADESTCVLPFETKWDGCGRNGGACQLCDYGAACSAGGQCTDAIDSRAVFLATIISVELTEERLGNNWDLLGNEPDPLVCVGSGVAQVCTSACSVSLTCDFASLGGATSFEITGEELGTTGLVFVVEDEDVDTNDQAGTITVMHDTLPPAGGYASGSFGA